jgi:hypothetical protein
MNNVKKKIDLIVRALAIVVCLPLFVGLFYEMRKRI